MFNFPYIRTKMIYNHDRWYKEVYDLNNNRIYYQHSGGYWYKARYDAFGDQIYYETAFGVIRDNRNV